jgi:hypothetical protein
MKYLLDTSIWLESYRFGPDQHQRARTARQPRRGDLSTLLTVF